MYIVFMSFPRLIHALTFTYRVRVPCHINSPLFFQFMDYQYGLWSFIFDITMEFIGCELLGVLILTQIHKLCFIERLGAY